MSEVEVTEVDVGVAADIMADTGGDPKQTRKRIALALAQAREEGYKAALADLTKSDTAIDVSPLRWVNGKRCATENHILDDQGVVRKVLGTLPITADGAVACEGATTWHPQGAEYRPVYICAQWPHGHEYDPACPVGETYSSPQAAESALEVANDK
jgi:hypothetical protein